MLDPNFSSTKLAAPQAPASPSKNTGARKFVKNTTSLCPVCKIECPGQVFEVSVQNQKPEIVLSRTCSEHGTFEFVISHGQFYWPAQGRPENGPCGCGPSCCSSSDGRPAFLGKNALDLTRLGIMEKLSTCIALIEIVESCNLSCPTCFASAPLGGIGANLKYSSFDDITSRIQSVINRKGKLEILQLSGGEPTLHPQFLKLVEWIRSHQMIQYLLINTNGVRFATDPDFVEQMGRLFKQHDNIQLYLQFDGPQQVGQIELRGGDLRRVREQAIHNCARINLPVTLAMTVTEANRSHLWDTVMFGLQFEHVRGVSFQPMFLSGRTHLGTPEVLPQPITVDDIVLGLHEQSGRKIPLEDFTALPCGDPNCHTIGWMIRNNGRYYPLATFGIDVASLQASFPDRLNFRIEDLGECGCDNTQLGNLLRKMEVRVEEKHAFRLFIKPFMDARTWDSHRTDRCCTHVIRKDGSLASFCRYYAGLDV